MRIELLSDSPSGEKNWVEVREVIKGGDIFAVREANEVELDDSGRAARISFQKAEDDRLIALSARVITAWSFQGVPVPSVQQSPKSAFAAARGVLSDLDARDLRAFRAGMRPLLELVSGEEQADPKSGGVPADAVDAGPAPEAEG